MAKRQVGNCPICYSEEDEIIDKIIEVSQIKNFSRNTTIYEQDSEAKGLYLIKKGTVKISNFSNNGKEVVLALLKEGDTFGEGSVLGEKKTTNVAFASTDTEIFFLPKKELSDIMKLSPNLYNALVTSLVKWMNNLNQIIEVISTPSAKERVHTYLKRLSSDQNTQEIVLNGKKFEIALMLGLRPETFSRTLTELEEDNLIKMNHKTIKIL